MEGKGKSVCLVLGGLGLAAVAAGFAAEATRVKDGQFILIISTATCVYPSSPAHALGLSAMAILCVIQIIVTITTGCGCCRRKSPNEEMLNSSTTLERIFAVVSWITFVVALVLFLLATELNSERNDAIKKGIYLFCQIVKPGVFAGASLLTLVCVGCGIGYINLVFKAPSLGNMNGTEGQFQPTFMPVGQPQHQYGAQQLQLGRK